MPGVGRLDIRKRRRIRSRGDSRGGLWIEETKAKLVEKILYRRLPTLAVPFRDLLIVVMIIGCEIKIRVVHR